ncbi:MAG: hypothetical protein R3B95_15845 [Nitrospirales bacterium]|nr:hypothetical protein [Nitrospirales bacterium]
MSASYYCLVFVRMFERCWVSARQPSYFWAGKSTKQRSRSSRRTIQIAVLPGQIGEADASLGRAAQLAEPVLSRGEGLGQGPLINEEVCLQCSASRRRAEKG